MVASLNLAGGRFKITADAGDNVAFSFNATAFDTTGFTLEFRFYELANDGEGPTGDILSTKTLTNGSGITNTGGTNSTIAIAVPSATTTGRDGSGFWCELVRTDVGFVRTLGKGPMVLQ